MHWHALLRCQYLYLCTSKASKLSTSHAGSWSEWPRRMSRKHSSRCARTTCQHTSAYVSIRPHTSAFESLRAYRGSTALVEVRAHETSRLNWPVTQQALRALLMASNAYLRFLWKSSESTRLQYTSAYVRIRQHSSAYVSIRQHPGILVGEQRVNAAAAPQVSVFVLLY